MSGLDQALVALAGAAQRKAFGVRDSVWVSASAGTGKTELLTRRMARLLIEDETLEPQEIVALTFTRAGAGEMAARLPEKIFTWADMDDAKLLVTVEEELGLRGEGATVARVRSLAAKLAVRGPVVTTIHGLAQTMLAGNALAAGVPLGFSVMEESERTRVLEEIQYRLLTKVDGALAESLAVLLDEFGDYGWRELTDLVVKGWRKLREIVAGKSLSEILRRLDERLELRGDEGWVGAPLTPTAEEMAVLKAVVTVVPEHGAGEVLRASGKQVERTWREFLLTDKDKARSRLFLKKELELVGEAAVEILQAAQLRVAEQVRLRKVLRGRTVTEALLAWALNVRAEYERRKQTSGVLDYDDLLDGLERLLARGEVVWERKYKHLVVDEAQDNNPQQDRLVRALMQSLLAGDVGEDSARTMLAVGDVKQSVFRFQGAVPGLFLKLQDEMQAWAGTAFKAVDVQHNFRSGAEILAAVDEVFMQETLGAEVMGVEQAWLEHLPVANRVSRVEIWPLVEGVKAEDLGPWPLPVTRWESEGDGADIVCMRQVGEFLKGVVGKVAVPSEKGRMLGWEDVMIVVQRNKVAALAAGIFRGMGIPVASGAGVVSQAVMDVVALARVAVDAEDRIALATVLKGMRGWTDAQILELAAKSGEWHENLPAGDAAWLVGFTALRLRPPLELVWQGMAVRGGALVEFEGLLEWAEQAGTLMALVARLEREDLPAAGSGEGLRIMTTHGAKGLQAPLVILPDTMARMGDLGRDRVLWGEDTFLVRSEKGISAFEDELTETESAARRVDSLRGLYVAMTRASDWLVVCGWGKGDKETWWNTVKTAAEKGDNWRDENGLRVRGGSL